MRAAQLFLPGKLHGRTSREWNLAEDSIGRTVWHLRQAKSLQIRLRLKPVLRTKIDWLLLQILIEPFDSQLDGLLARCSVNAIVSDSRDDHVLLWLRCAVICKLGVLLDVK